MTLERPDGEEIRRFLLECVERRSQNIGPLAAARFGITRQAVSKHLRKLVEAGLVTESGNTRARAYTLAPASSWEARYAIEPGLDEHVVWARHVKPRLAHLPENVLNIWQIGVTQMLHNAIDHSEGRAIHVEIARNAVECEVAISDDGVGILRKLQGALGLPEPRHALLELSKGKLTTEPRSHAGVGIFFTSRMLDAFDIASGGVLLSRELGAEQRWVVGRHVRSAGSTILMRLRNYTSRTARKVYDTYLSPDSPEFEKTVIPVRLARRGDEALGTRSQARLVLARAGQFARIELDFAAVPGIGEDFVDEIFRVFAVAHPHAEISATNAAPAVLETIARVHAR